MKQDDQPIVAVDGVTKKFQRLLAVDNVTFRVAPGEVVGLVGDNESGKTTLIAMMMGFSRPTKGSIMLFGDKLRPFKAHRSHREIGYTACDISLPRTKTGEQYLRALFDNKRPELHKKYERLVRAFRPRVDIKMSGLSAHDTQKIALIAALINSPKLLVLDEPMISLDPLSREVLLDAVRDAARAGTTVIISSQFPDDIARVCSRLLLFKDGALQADLAEPDLTAETGKVVTIYSEQLITLPPGAKKIRTGGHRKTKFSYTGSIEALLKWTAELSDIDDITIEPRSLNDTFSHLYEQQEEVEDA